MSESGKSSAHAAQKQDQDDAADSSTAADEHIDERPRQVIAVSASKGPAAFFNLARKFLVTDEYCDLSALEGAIVAAVDAAHLLERSKLATIVRVKTSYVTVEPKRKKDQGEDVPPPSSDRSRELRRARIVITVRRSGSYKAWLDENPLQAVIAADVGDTEAQL